MPVYIDDKSTKRELSAQSIHASKASAQSARKTITIYEKKRPVQKLTVDKKFVSPPPDQQARIKEDRKKVQQALSQKLPGRLWDIPLERPVPGSVSSLFGLKRVFNGQPRGIHKGLDLRGAEGTPIKACADGKSGSGRQSLFLGKYSICKSWRWSFQRLSSHVQTTCTAWRNYRSWANYRPCGQYRQGNWPSLASFHICTRTINRSIAAP